VNPSWKMNDGEWNKGKTMESNTGKRRRVNKNTKG
jgi:hypothetical protein